MKKDEDFYFCDYCLEPTIHSHEIIFNEKKDFIDVVCCSCFDSYKNLNIIPFEQRIEFYFH